MCIGSEAEADSSHFRNRNDRARSDVSMGGRHAYLPRLICSIAIRMSFLSTTSGNCQEQNEIPRSDFWPIGSDRPQDPLPD